MEYSDYLIEMRGIIVSVDTGSVSIDFKGRMGHIKIPLRMLVSEHSVKVGDEVAFRISLIEIVSEAAK